MLAYENLNFTTHGDADFMECHLSSIVSSASRLWCARYGSCSTWTARHGPIGSLGGLGDPWIVPESLLEGFLEEITDTTVGKASLVSCSAEEQIEGMLH